MAESTSSDAPSRTASETMAQGRKGEREDFKVDAMEAMHQTAKASLEASSPPKPKMDAADEFEKVAEEGENEETMLSKKPKLVSLSMPVPSVTPEKRVSDPPKPSHFGRSKTEKMSRAPISKSEHLRQLQMTAFVESVLKSSRLQNGTVEIGALSATDIASKYPNYADILGDHEPFQLIGEEPDDQEKVVPPLNICILIVGTRGDVQPFIAIGLQLQKHGHRVRLATHAQFREFVTGEGLEFYPLGGDPKILAEYMVNNKGFLPSWPSEVAVQRKQLKAIIDSTWGACTEPDPGSNGLGFVADAIIANPPTMGHTHVAEKLKVPLHVFFTMPWTPTKIWPHPLARVQQVVGFENRLSYAVVENMIWMGTRDIVNSFRKRKLKLGPITYLKAPLRKQEVPMGYIWSPSLAPKPEDWGHRVDVVGFCFLNLASNYKPPQDLVDFLDKKPAPIYVGFGSLPVKDPNKMTQVIVDAMAHTKQRAIIQKGWGGLGVMENTPPHIYLLGNCPHDWLFPQCAAVVHHGGAGTTAAGLKAECPTTVVPFFGDQPFWGHCVNEQGVGPKPIPVEHFDFDNLVHAITTMLEPDVKEAAKKMAAKIGSEDGVKGAVSAFHRHLPPHTKHGAHSLTWMKKTSWAASLFPCFLPKMNDEESGSESGMETRKDTGKEMEKELAMDRKLESKEGGVLLG